MWSGYCLQHIARRLMRRDFGGVDGGVRGRPGAGVGHEEEHTVILVMAWTLMWGCFLPASNLLFPVGFVVAERVLYLPSLGASLLLAQLVTPRANAQKEATNQRITALRCLLVVGMVIAAVWRTRARNRAWGDALVLWQSAVRVVPSNAKAHNGLGFALFQVGQVEEALEHLRLSLHLLPTYAEAYYNLGSVLSARGGVSRVAGSAEEDTARSQGGTVAGASPIEFGPDGRRSALQEAADAFAHALQLEPRHASAQFNLGTTMHALGDYRDAAAALTSSTRLTSLSGLCTRCTHVRIANTHTHTPTHTHAHSHAHTAPVIGTRTSTLGPVCGFLAPTIVRRLPTRLLFSWSPPARTPSIPEVCPV